MADTNFKDFRVSYRPKHEQIFKRNYTFFNTNEFKNKINQIDWITSFISHDVKLFWEIFEYLYLRFWCQCTHQSRNYRKRRNLSLTNLPWIDNYLRYLMRARDACFIKYCRAKIATEKIKIQAKYKILRN